MVGTLAGTVYSTVKQLICLSAFLCLLTLTACTKAVPTLTALGSQTEGLALKPASQKIFSSTGNLEFSGACDARLKNLKIKVADGEWIRLSEATDPNGPQNIDCASRNLNFKLPHALFGFDDAGLTEGQSIEKELQIQATSEFGAAALQRMKIAFVKDTLAPTVTITAKNTINAAEAPAYVFQGTCESGIPVQVTYDTTSIEVPCVNSQFSREINFSTRDESVIAALTIYAKQTDEAGNVSVNKSIAVNLDRTPPDFAPTFSPDFIVGSNLSSVRLTGRCESGIDIKMTAPIVGTLTCPGDATSANFSLTYPAADFAESAATFNVTFEQTDAVGNKTVKTIAHQYKDTTAGAITLGIAHTIVNAKNSFSGTCTIGEGNVYLSLKDANNATFNIGMANCVANVGWSFADIALTALAEGTVTVAAYQLDNHGNKSSEQSGSFALDRTPPPVAITTYPAVYNLSHTLSQSEVSGTCEVGSTLTFTVTGFDSATETGVTGAVVASNPVCNSSGQWTAKIDLAGLANKSANQIHLGIVAKDAAGNTKPASKDVPADFIAPNPVAQIPVVNAYINIANNTTFRFKGTCTAGDLDVVVKGPTVAGGSTEFSASIPCAGGIYDRQINMSSLSEGSLSFSISQSDNAGNKTTLANLDLFKDVTRPTTPTAIGALIETKSSALNELPKMAPNGSSDPSSSSSPASGLKGYKVRVYEQSGTEVGSGFDYDTSGANVSRTLSGTALDKTKIYDVTVNAIDNAGNESASSIGSYFDYCESKTIVIHPPAEKLNSDDVYTASVRIPKSCAQGSIVVQARGEAGRLASGAHSVGYGGGGIASGIFKGAAFYSLLNQTTKLIDIKFAGAGRGGKDRASAGNNVRNGNSGGRYAWASSGTSGSLINVVAGGGGGTATANDATGENLPGLGGDQGIGEGLCFTSGEERKHCGRNGDARVWTMSSGIGGTAGLTDGACAAGSDGGHSSVAPADGGNAGVSTLANNDAGGGGGGWGGGGAGGGGPNSFCKGRSGGGGGSLVAGSAQESSSASSLIAGAWYDYPEVRITFGLKTDVCPNNYTFIPPTAPSLNTSSSVSDAGFCIANFEAAIDGSMRAVFVAGATPTSNVRRADAVAACSANTSVDGRYKLPVNKQWQAVANIAHWTSMNWIQRYPGIVAATGGNYMLYGRNQNYRSGGTTAAANVAGNSCAGTSSTSCGISSLDAARRTYQLGNSSANIWDLNANLAEWISDANPYSTNQADSLISNYQRTQVAYSFVTPTIDYSKRAGLTNMGLGQVRMSSIPTDPGVLRGSSYVDQTTDSGPFTADGTKSTTQQSDTIGFRCVFEPYAPGF